MANLRVRGLSQRSRQDSMRVKDRGAGVSLNSSRFNFEERAPWYLYNSSTEGKLGATGNVVPVVVFKDELMQGSKREVRVHLPRDQLFAVNWAQAALHLRLSKPPGQLEFD